jgi:hypothetical protein
MDVRCMCTWWWWPLRAWLSSDVCRTYTVTATRKAPRGRAPASGRGAIGCTGEQIQAIRISTGEPDCFVLELFKLLMCAPQKEIVQQIFQCGIVETRSLAHEVAMATAFHRFRPTSASIAWQLIVVVLRLGAVLQCVKITHLISIAWLCLASFVWMSRQYSGGLAFSFACAFA